MSWLRSSESELPLKGQCLAVLALAVVWLLAVQLALDRNAENQRTGKYFVSPFLVFTVVWLWVPLTLSVGGLLILIRHARNLSTLSRGQVALYLSVGVLTLASVVVCVLYGLPATSLPSGRVLE